MARQPNYGAERRDRERRKSEKRQKRQEAKESRSRERQEGAEGDVQPEDGVAGTQPVSEANDEPTPE